jgi:GNAT superfamily N-acetyltransferase
MIEYEVRKENFLITTDKAKLDIDSIHKFLSHSYWAGGRTKENVIRSIKNSLCFGVYDEENGKQSGFARAISDYTTFVYIADLYITEEYRRKGLSKFLMKSIMEHPEFKNIEKWVLATRDAHGLYKQFGFLPLPFPDRFMMKKNIKN